MPDTNVEEYTGLASRVGNLLGVLENIIDGNSEETSPEDVTTLGEGNVIDGEGEVEKNVDPLEQIRTEIAMLRKQGGAVDKLQAQIAMLPGKEEIVSAVLARIPAPKCTCNNEHDEINRPLDEFDPRI